MKESLLQFFINEIAQRGKLIFIDIGAMGGIPSKWKAIQGAVKSIGFEPDVREFQKLKNTDHEQFLNYVVYQRSENLKLNISQDPGKTSIYHPNFQLLNDFPNAERHQIVESVEFSREQVDSLDNILQKHQVCADFLKIDTQGSELDILRGAENSLKDIFGVELEVEFIPLYENQPLFSDIQAFMTQKGFVLYDLRRAFWKRKEYFDYVGKGQLIFGDTLYLKRVDDYLKMLATISDEKKRALKILNAITTCLIYGIFDYAVLLVEGAGRQGIIAADYKEQLARQISRVSKQSSLPNFWGKEFLYKGFNRLAESLKPQSHLGWADGDRFIGNVKNH